MKHSLIKRLLVLISLSSDTFYRLLGGIIAANSEYKHLLFVRNVLRSLGWLSVGFWTLFKLFVFTFKAFHDLGATFLQLPPPKKNCMFLSIGHILLVRKDKMNSRV